MSTKPRKIGFFYLTALPNINVAEAIKNLLTEISNLPKEERKFDLGSTKFMLLDSYTLTNNGLKSKVLIKSATHSYRPNLLHRDTVEERENPKLLEEGDSEKTHIAMKFIGSRVCFILEKKQAGVNIGQFITYLNNYSHTLIGDPIITYGYETVVKENFLEEVRRLSRVVSTQVVVDKQLLGSDALNFSENIDSVKHDIVVNVTAKNRDSITDFAQDVFALINRGRRDINRIRIVGRNQSNQEVIINTDFLERQEYINAEFRPGTGEVVTDDVFLKMYNVLNNFE